MSTALLGLFSAAILSISSLLLVLIRVSPLSTPHYALPLFFVALFLSVATVSASLLLLVRTLLTSGRQELYASINASLRQGVFLGCFACCVVIFHLLGLLTWWIAILIGMVFFFIEMAVQG